MIKAASAKGLRFDLDQYDGPLESTPGAKTLTSRPVGVVSRSQRLLAFGDPDQTVAGDEGTLCGRDDVAEADQLVQMRSRHRWARRGDRNFDQGGKLLGRQKLGWMDGHLQLAIKSD